MYETLKNYLENGSYTLTDGNARIDYAVARGNITPEQAAELTAILEVHGTPEELTAKSLDERVSDIETAIEELAGLISSLMNDDPVEVEA